ncbi:MAG: hypothetical protein Ct9H300mP23_02090 [Nitrospinota bacterium]|nr:MAG: hypothetical protein Ct9H300mP23_02090 [Nitrospinota bacterium]
MGTPTSELIFNMAGGIQNDNKLKAFIPGGSSVPMLPADKVELPMIMNRLRQQAPCWVPVR